jgi:hypothetical protein
MVEDTPRDLKETEKAVEDAFEFNDDESFQDVVESLDIAPAVPAPVIPEENFLDSEETSQEPELISDENLEKNVESEPQQPEVEVEEAKEEEAVVVEEEEPEAEEEEEKHEELQNVVNALQDSFQQLSASTVKEKEATELVGLGLVMANGAEGDAKVEDQVTGGPPKIKTDVLPGDNDFVPPTPGTPPIRSPFDPNSPVEDSDDIETYSANLLALNKVDIKNIGPNNLDAREQEKAGKLAGVNWG